MKRLSEYISEGLLSNRVGEEHFENLLGWLCLASENRDEYMSQYEDKYKTCRAIKDIGRMISSGQIVMIDDLIERFSQAIANKERSVKLNFKESQLIHYICGYVHKWGDITNDIEDLWRLACEIGA